MIMLLCQCNTKILNSLLKMNSNKIKLKVLLKIWGRGARQYLISLRINKDIKKENIFII